MPYRLPGERSLGRHPRSRHAAGSDCHDAIAPEKGLIAAHEVTPKDGEHVEEVIRSDDTVAAKIGRAGAVGLEAPGEAGEQRVAVGRDR